MIYPDSPGTDLVADARIELIEQSDGFLVVHGWLIPKDPAVPPPEVSISIDGILAKVSSFFPRDDVGHPNAGRGLGFTVDLAYPAPFHPNCPILLRTGEDPPKLIPTAQIAVRPFLPRASFDPSTLVYVAGWVYDPRFWLGRVKPILELEIDTLRVPLALSTLRYELPFGSAHQGRYLGFQIDVSSVIVANPHRPIEGSIVPLRLILDGTVVASTTVTATYGGLEPSPVGLSGTSTEGPIGTHQGNRLPRVIGYIEYGAFCPGINGWLVGGWIYNAALDRDDVLFRCSYAPQDASSKFVIFARDDVSSFGKGIIIYLPSSHGSGRLPHVVFANHDNDSAFEVSDGAKIVSAATAIREAQRRASSPGVTAYDHFNDLLSRPFFDGSDTIAALAPHIQFAIDECIDVSTAGIAIIGWLVDQNDDVDDILVTDKFGNRCSIFHNRAVYPRPDIAAAIKPSSPSNQFGFTAFAYGLYDLKDDAHVEMRLKDGRVAHRRTPSRSSLKGLDAIRRLLADPLLKGPSFIPVVKTVLSPAILQLNRERLTAVTVTADEFGERLEAPRLSIIVPLFGRIDYMAAQLALFDRNEHASDEFIYVLDQPERYDECYALAALCQARTRANFVLLTTSRNGGFAVASNFGLTEARGTYTCFLNSDVFPGDNDWGTRLIVSLQADSTLGLIGPQLLFEDDSIQHRGMGFKRLSQFGDLPFPYHFNKGKRPGPCVGIVKAPAITGACMLGRTELIRSLGGFDTDYIVGDFEDADLCMKVSAVGLDCGVDDRVLLYHLERQSQGRSSNRVRQNITLANAYTFARRWDPRHNEMLRSGGALT